MTEFHLMFWRRKAEPRPDPIGDMCRLMVERPWEWEGVEEEEDFEIVHDSGVRIAWRTTDDDESRDYWVWVAPVGTEWVRLRDGDADRVLRAVCEAAASRVALRPRPFGQSAQALARAVLLGDHVAASRLSDEVFEAGQYVTGPKPTENGIKH